jgi:hypothetical protein
VGVDWENPVKNNARIRRVVKEALRMEYRMKGRDRFTDDPILSTIDFTAILSMQKCSIPRA